MANFRTHISIAAFGSIAATAVCIQKVGLSDEQALLLFILGCLGGMLPDVDSNHSIPARWLFRCITGISLWLVGSMTYAQVPMLQWGLIMLLTFSVSHFIIAALIRSLTVHRGMFHSIPAAALAGIIAYMIAQYFFTYSSRFLWLIASFITGGYLLHLLLDECYRVDLLGRRLKRSFGTALKLFQRRRWKSYLILYLLLAWATWQWTDISLFSNIHRSFVHA